MNYGYFDKENNEYVVTRPDTPTPWINYLGQGKYGGIISATAGGYSFYKDPRNCRVTRYRYNGVPMDRPGRYIYISVIRKRESIFLLPGTLFRRIWTTTNVGMVLAIPGLLES